MPIRLATSRRDPVYGGTNLAGAECGVVMALLSTKLPWELAQTKWPSILNPVLSLPILSGNKVT